MEKNLLLAYETILQKLSSNSDRIILELIQAPIMVMALFTLRKQDDLINMGVLHLNKLNMPIN